MKSLSPVILAWALAGLATPRLHAAAPPHQPVSGTLYFTRYSGSPRVNKIDFVYDGNTNFFLTNLVGIVDLPGADGLVIEPDGNLIIGGQGNSVYKVDPLTATVLTAVPNGSSYHMSLDPNRTRAWSGWQGSALMEIPLNPFGNGTAHNLTGDDNSVLTLAWDTAGNVYYTSGSPGGGGVFGTINLTNFTTKRLMASVPAAHGMAFDPFSGALILFGSDHITQFSANPTNAVVISDLTVGGLGIQFDQGTLDGRGHLFVADNNGKLAFLDYTTTHLVNHTNNFLATPFLANSPDDVAPISLVGTSTNVADLTLSLLASADPAPVHTNVTLTLVVTNKGPDTATGLRLTTTIPGNVTLISATATQGTLTNQDGNWVLLVDSLANASSVSLALVVQPLSGPMFLRGNVVANETDPYFFDNFASRTVAAPVACVHPAGMVAWWPADGNPNDMVGTNHASLLGAATYQPGEVGLGFGFNADGAGVTASNSPAFNVASTGFTAEFWLHGRNNQPQGLFTVLEKSHGFIDSSGWAFQGNSGNGTIQFFIGAGGGGANNFVGSTSANSVLDGRWHHLAGTWDGTNVWLYVDGVAQGSTALATPANNTRALNIGFAWGNNSPQRFFRGVVDEVTFYNRALSAAEVEAIYAADSAGKCAQPLMLPNPLPVGVTNLPYSAQLSLAYATPVYQFALDPNSGPLPPGLTLAPSGLLSGIPTTAGSYPVRIRGLDASNEVAEADYTLQVVTCTPPPLGLIGWWPGEGNAKDAIGVHNGTVQNGVTFVPGLDGQAFSLDGNSGYVDLGQWSPGAQWTLEAWVNPSALPSGRHTIVGGLQECRDWGIALVDGQLAVVIRPPGGCTQNVQSGLPAQVGTWYHVVGTCDGASGRIYVNGVLLNAAPVDPNYIGTTAGARIGGEVCCGGDNFPGLIDEVSIYDRALAPAEIQALYTANAAGKCPGGLPPTLTTQPQSQVLVVGDNAAFTVGASGPGPLTYQWFYNQVPIAAATNASLNLPSLKGPETGLYSAAVSNPSGTLISASALLTVINLNLYAGVLVNGIVGKNYHIDYVNNLAATNNWITLTNFTLQSSPYLYIDTQSPTVPKRYYRVVFSP